MPPQGVQQIEKTFGPGHAGTLADILPENGSIDISLASGLPPPIRWVYPPASEEETPMFTHYVAMNAPKSLDRLSVQGEGVCMEGA
jgi:hypothetical protein